MWVWRRERERVVRPVKRRAEISPWLVAAFSAALRKLERCWSGRYFNATATRSEMDSCGM
jgi:hypothetical protein